MAKINFNDHIDDMMERLMNEDLSAEDLDKEIKRSKALCLLAEKKIEDRKVAVMAMQVVGNVDFDRSAIPTGIKNYLEIDQTK